MKSTFYAHRLGFSVGSWCLCRIPSQALRLHLILLIVLPGTDGWTHESNGFTNGWLTMRDERASFRISMHRKGFLTRSGDTTVCTIDDITDKGLHLVNETSLVIGETVNLEFQLIARTVIHCTILVIHTQGPQIGTRIIQISTTDHEALSTSA